MMNTRKLLLSLSLILVMGSVVHAQTFEWDDEKNTIIQLDEKNKNTEKNIEVVKLHSVEETTGFLIWVEDTVRPHYHAKHNETLYFISGEGYFYIGGKKHWVKPGSFVSIPKTVVHAFKTTSEEPVKAISIQAPEFLGKDRIFIEPEKPTGNPDY